MGNDKPIQLNPFGDRIVAKPRDGEGRTAGGILLAPQSQDGPALATVVAVGPGAIGPDGRRAEPQARVGQVVLHPRHAGEAFEAGGEKLLILRESDILASLA